MNYWKTDAKDITIDSADSFYKSGAILINNEIKDFLNKDSSKRFVVAPKGLGKTLILKAKSKIVREDYGGKGSLFFD